MCACKVCACVRSMYLWGISCVSMVTTQPLWIESGAWGGAGRRRESQRGKTDGERWRQKTDRKSKRQRERERERKREREGRGYGERNRKVYERRHSRHM